MIFLSFFRISGHSMEPTIVSGSIVFVSSIPYIFSKPKIGDVVLLRVDDKRLVKRVQKINGDKYFVAGDNRNDSYDSRKFGILSRSHILGKVIFRIHV